MRGNTHAIWLRNITAASLALVIFTTSSMIALASPADKSLMGEITVSGQATNGNAPSVTLNGENAFTGRTFFSNSTIATNDAASTVKLGKLGYIVLNPNTTLNLSFDERTISGTLTAGQIKVFNADGVDVKIQNLNNATATVEPMNTKKDDDNKGGIFHNSATGPLLVFAGIVTAVVIIVLVNNNDNNNTVSTVR